MTRYGAIAVLKQTGGPAAVDVLVQALGHTEGATRRRIITALGDLGDKRAIPHLIPLVGTRSLLESLLPDEATVALRKLTGQALTSREQWQKWYDASLDKPPEKR
jgi:HEAT repeat protein